MNKTSKIVKLNAFDFSVGKYDIHMRVQRDKRLYYFSTWSIRKFSTIQEVLSLECEDFQGPKLFKCSVDLSVNQDKVEIMMNFHKKFDDVYKQCVTISTDGGIVLFYETSNITLSSFAFADDVLVTGEDFQKLKQLPNDTLVLTYRIIRGVDEFILKPSSCNTAISNSEYLKSLEADLKNYSSSFLKQKVSLCVGQETEIVNKAVLCARSTVFAKMFDSDMKENESNTVTITDIKMPVLRALVAFLCSGFLPDCGFTFVCDLYYAANRYDIWELHQACIRSMFGKITCENILRVLKLSALHNDELLKSAVMTLISANIENVALAHDWKDLMCDDPMLAVKASKYFDL